MKRGMELYDRLGTAPLFWMSLSFPLLDCLHDFSIFFLFPFPGLHGLHDSLRWSCFG